MPTRCVLFRFNNNPKIDTLLKDCQEMIAKTINYALQNRKTATFALINALYPNFREKFPHLHSLWLQSSIMAGAAIVHSFKNRKRKKRAKESPEIKQAFVYVSKEMLKFDFDGETLKIARTYALETQNSPLTFGMLASHADGRCSAAFVRAEKLCVAIAQRAIFGRCC